MRENIQLGIAPIGWTNDDLPELGGEIPFEQCISEMALAGYTGCEVGNKYPRDTAVLRKALELRGLRICNQWFTFTLTTNPFEQVKKDFEAHLDFLEAMGADIVGGGACGHSIQGLPDPVLGKKIVFTEEEWKRLTNGLNALGELAQKRGLSLCLHHHMGTGIQSLEEVDRLMESTDPNYVFLNYDCGHFYFAGEDPVKALEKHIGRTRHIHLKDVRPAVLERVMPENLSFLQAVKAGIYTVPGDPEGCIDFPALIKIIDEHQYKGWVVVEAEQDPAKANPFEYSKMAYEYLQGLMN